MHSSSSLKPSRSIGSKRWIARTLLVSVTLFVLSLDDEAPSRYFPSLRRSLSKADRETVRIHRRLRELAKKHVTPRDIPPLPPDEDMVPDTIPEQEEFKAKNHPIMSNPPIQNTAPLVKVQPKAFMPAEKYLGKIFPKTEQMPFYLRNTLEPFPESRDERDIIFFWHIPHTGGEMIKTLFGRCFRLRWAQKLKEPASLELVHEQIVNVDTSTIEGIADAHRLGLVDSNKVDFISSRYGLSASSLFTDQHHGRAFTILRHPVELAASNFFARKTLHKDIRSLTLAQYSTKNFYADNWMTRQLTGTLPHEELTPAHLESAKRILSTKYFVGIYEQMEETVRQLKAFYKMSTVEDQDYCVKDLVTGNDPKFTKSKHPSPVRGSADWKIVAEVEKWDMELYYLALEMFSQQGSIFIAQEYTLVG